MAIIKTVLIGFGYRGKQLFRLLQHIPSFHIAAIADPCVASSDVEGCMYYSDGEEDYLRMIREECPDLVVIASPWRHHVQQTLHCLQAGCHVALEIKGGLCQDEYQAVIELSKTVNRNVYPLENTIFMREILAIYNATQAGVLGEIVHMTGGYRHDLRNLLIDSTGRLTNPNDQEGSWRSHFYETENGDLYPTHGLAPLCLIAGINRKDRMKSLTSFASKSVGIKQRIHELAGDERVAVRMGDIVSTQLQTESGVLISLIHDTTLPRPRSLHFEVQGTKGIWNGERRAIYIEHQSPYETWEPDDSYISQYEHPYWQQWGEEALRIDVHHQGMDYIMLKALESDLKEESVYPVTIDDLALWTSVSPYSKQSIREGRTISLLPLD